MEIMNFTTSLGQLANNNLLTFKQYCTDEEFQILQKAVKQFDSDNHGFGFYAIQANQKLKWISEMDFETFQGVMFVYFGKTPSELILN